MRGDSKGTIALAILIGLLIVGILALVVFSGEAKAAGGNCTPNVSTTDKAHHRAQRGWDSDKVKKRPKVIDRVRLQARCVPDGAPQAFVKGHIKQARKQYRKAKEKAKIKAFYDKLTASPGQARLAVLRQCESTNRYNDPAAPAGAYGMLQGWSLALTYWTKKMTRYFGYPSSPPYTATPDQQDILASLLYQHHGTGPWECPF